MSYLRPVLVFYFMLILSANSWAETSLLAISGTVALPDGRPARNAIVEVKNLSRVELNPLLVNSDGQGHYRAFF